MYKIGRIKLLLFILCLKCAVPGILGAMGQTETTIDQAKKLFMDKEYKQATVLFSQAWRENPELKQEAQAYIDEIMQRARRSNEIKEDIKKELYNNKDIEATVKLIDELRAIDPDVEEYIKEIDKGIRVIYNFNQFTKIMDDAYRLVSEQKFPEAVETYYQGFTLHRDEFYEKTEYGNIIRSAVQNSIKQTEQMMAAYAAQVEKAKIEAGRLNTIIASGNTETITRQARIVIADLQSLLDYRNKVRALGRQIIKRNDQLKAINKGGKGDNFLFYVYQTILGRTGNNMPEGLFFVIEKHWEQIENREIPEIRKAADRLYLQAKQTLQGNNLARSKLLFDQARQMYGLCIEFTGGYFKVLTGKSALPLKPYAKIVVEQNLPLYLYFLARIAESTAYPELADRKEVYDTLSASIEKTDDTVGAPKLTVIRQNINSESETLNAEKLKWMQKVKDYSGAQKDDELLQLRLSSARDMVAYIDSLLSSYAQLQKGSAVKIATLEYSPLLAALEDQEQRFAGGKKLRGTPGEAPDSPKYPTRSMKIYDSLINDTDTLAAKIGRFRKNWANEDKEISSQAGIRELLTKAGDLGKRLDILQSAMGAEIKATQQQQLTARQYRDKGQDDYNRAKTSAARNDFKTARNHAEDAIVALRESLLFEEDSGVRKLLEQELVKYSSDIYIAWRNKIIDDVQQAIRDSEKLTNSTQFNEAEQILVQAKNLWKQLDEGENAEIDESIKRVQFAKEYTNSRIIEPTHPMYGNVVSWLNLANQYYQAALKLLRQGDRPGAMSKFAQALANISNIKKEFPYHEESGILELKIEKETRTKKEFDELFAVNFNRVKGKKDPSSLATLENLYAINPNYPGLAAARREALIANRILEAPVPAADIREAETLYQQAYALTRTRSRDNYIRARNLLNDSLKLNPKNQKARDLFYWTSRILGDLGTTLTREDQAAMIRINEAIKAGNRPLAIQLLQPLIAKYPANQDVLRAKTELGL